MNTVRVGRGTEGRRDPGDITVLFPLVKRARGHGSARGSHPSVPTGESADAPRNRGVPERERRPAGRPAGRRGYAVVMRLSCNCAASVPVLAVLAVLLVTGLVAGRTVSRGCALHFLRVAHPLARDSRH